MKYSMAQVENLTGIKSHTLRIWERRYSFLKPERTKSNIRFYSDDQLRMLLNIETLSRNGYRISKIDQMSLDEINDSVVEILSKASTENKDEINALTLSMLDLDEEAFNKVFNRRIIRKGLQLTITELIYPFLKHIGVLWGASKAIPVQEHFISNLVRQKIISAIDSIPMALTDAPKIMFFLDEDEDHEIGLLLSAFIAKDLGWQVLYLGPNVPTSNLKTAIEIGQPKLMMSMFIIPGAAKKIKEIEEIADKSDIPLVLAGNPVNFKDEAHTFKSTYIPSPDDFVNYLKSWS